MIVRCSRRSRPPGAPFASRQERRESRTGPARRALLHAAKALRSVTGSRPFGGSNPSLVSRLAISSQPHSQSSWRAWTRPIVPRPMGWSLAESSAWERPTGPCPEPGRGCLEQAQERSADDWLRTNVRDGCHRGGRQCRADRHALRSAGLSRHAAIRQIRCKTTRLVGPGTSPLEIWRAKPYVNCGIVARWDSLPPTTGFIPQPVRYSAYPRAGLLAAVS